MSSDFITEWRKNFDPKRRQQLIQHFACYTKTCGVKDRLLRGKYRPKYRRSITREHARLRYLAEHMDGTAGVCYIG